MPEIDSVARFTSSTDEDCDSPIGRDANYTCWVDGIEELRVLSHTGSYECSVAGLEDSSLSWSQLWWSLLAVHINEDIFSALALGFRLLLTVSLSLLLSNTDGNPIGRRKYPDEDHLVRASFFAPRSSLSKKNKRISVPLLLWSLNRSTVLSGNTQPWSHGRLLRMTDSSSCGGVEDTSFSVRVCLLLRTTDDGVSFCHFCYGLAIVASIFSYGVFTPYDGR
ncbi:Protein of unknown function [Pyronema omphalodes CBS 100304]|nr:Protein of unknown function [Pyronema omphalodes CBS 100304]